MERCVYKTPNIAAQIKNGQFPTLGNSPEIDTTGTAGVRKPFAIGGVSGSLERFPGLTKIRIVQNLAYSPGSHEFTRNRHKKSRKELEVHLQESRRRFREFGAISRPYQIPPCSKPWPIAQGRVFQSPINLMPGWVKFFISISDPATSRSLNRGKRGLFALCSTL